MADLFDLGVPDPDDEEDENPLAALGTPEPALVEIGTPDPPLPGEIIPPEPAPQFAGPESGLPLLERVLVGSVEGDPQIS